MQASVSPPVASELAMPNKAEVCRTLYSKIKWDDVLRQGEVKDGLDHALLEKAQNHLESVLNEAEKSRSLVNMLLQLTEYCVSNVVVQQYAFTKMEQILGLGAGVDEAAEAEAHGFQYASLFTQDGQHISESTFVKALRGSNNSYVQQSAAVVFACLFSAKLVGDMDALVAWIIFKLKHKQDWEKALPALNMLCRSHLARTKLAEAGAVSAVSGQLKNMGPGSNAQQVYELCFQLWALSLDAENIAAFIPAGAVPALVDQIAAPPTKKVIRVALGALKNLCHGEDNDIINAMFTAGLLRLVENQGMVKSVGDTEIEEDFKYVHNILLKNYRELSSFERWANEVSSGALRSGIVHTEKFWKANARFVDTDNFALLKKLISLLDSGDMSVVCIALFDIGEFCRFYPNGRVIVSRLGAKDSVMQMMAHDDPEVQRCVLQCVIKIMVNNWEFMR